MTGIADEWRESATRHKPNGASPRMHGAAMSHPSLGRNCRGEVSLCARSIGEKASPRPLSMGPAVENFFVRSHLDADATSGAAAGSCAPTI